MQQSVSNVAFMKLLHSICSKQDRHSVVLRVVKTNAKASKLHTISEDLILSAIIGMVETLNREKEAAKLKAIFVSIPHNQKKIIDIAEDIPVQVFQNIEKCTYLSLQILQTVLNL